MSAAGDRWRREALAAGHWVGVLSIAAMRNPPGAPYAIFPMTQIKVSPEQRPYELVMFAKKHGLPVIVAREILEKYGADRAGADAAAQQVVARS